MANSFVKFAQEVFRVLFFPFRARRVLRRRFDRLEDRQRAMLDQLTALRRNLDDLMGKANPLRRRFSRLEGNKRALVDYACGELGVRSIADLAGAWCDPPGGYSFYAMEKYGVPTVYLVDVHMPEELLAEGQHHPGFHPIHGHVGAKEVAEQIPPVDAVFLFDILYLSVKPDWDELLDMYANRTRWFFISNLMFSDFDHAVRLFDLGEEEYFNCVPYSRNDPGVEGLFAKLDEPHPEDPTRTYRDFTHFYQWGMTDEALIGKMKSLGFDLYFLKTICKRSDIKKNAWSRLFAFTRS
jgi:hypothetical protein